ncbi:HAD family hydrolase [Paenibacillus sp. XY044]|uniref:HAD family hydrolase n=1 Tax=Paenibacillus sp. XY044 TaxID=2026089 RepID=UPI000B98A30C|nr:HAD family hydrolase [Paenibacillus sp. XY044]OZB94405.1 hydrolase [Paenibacillus sp. XY044]
MNVIDKKKLIVFLDSGDTLVDESTEVRDEDGIVVSAELIPGAAEMVRTLHSLGFTLALVADGDAQSFKNVLSQHRLHDYFEALIISEHIKATKPSPRMFKAAIGALDGSEADFARTVMVGNNLSRDIKGANALGIISVFQSWTPRYPHIPADESEQPAYTINEPMQLIELVNQLEIELGIAETAGGSSEPQQEQQAKGAGDHVAFYESIRGMGRRPDPREKPAGTR